MRQAIIVTIAIVAMAVTAGLDSPSVQAANATTQDAPVRLAQNTNANAFALLQDIQRLREQVRSLRGEVQSLQHQLQRSQHSRQRMYEQLDQRLTALEQGGAGTTGGAADDAQAKQAYQAAFDELRDGKYDSAISSFEAFIKEFPNTQYSGQALYWLGQARYVQGDLSGAMDALQKMTSKFPDSSRVPSALLRMGVIQQTVGKTGQARETFQRIIKDYPDSDSAAKAREKLQSSG